MAQGIFNLKQVNQAIRQGAWPNSAPNFVEYLVVAGGGSGGVNSGGGGGAGGLLTGIVPVTPGSSYTVTVGAGGAAASAPTGGATAAGNNGSNSVFGSVTATGGGGGARDTYAGSSGGSGGGGSGFPTPPGQGVANQGNSGGSTSNLNPSGGGGAGTAGNLGGVTFPTSGHSGGGGAGIASAITGTVITYAGGGGGAGDYRGTAAGLGGVGGGGSGTSVRGGIGGSGAVNTGGGGGATSYSAGSSPPQGNSGSGGSGIVVVRYPGNIVFYTGGTVNYNNGYISHIFTSNGTLAPTAPAPYNTSYQISRSLRFNRADTNTLTRTPAVAGSRTTYSLSFWIKNPFSSGNDNPLWGQSSISRESLAFSGFSYSHNPIVWIPFTGFEYRTTQGFRDNSAWYHVVAVGDSSNATAGDRARLYINGSRVTDFAASPTITQNSQTGQLNTAVLHYIGQQWSGDGGLTGFYLTEMHFIDGQALTPSSFGATSTTTGVWAPIKYTGTYGTNGFYLNFSDNSNNTAATLGKDYSGNGNNWSPNSFTVTAGVGNDSLVDTPTPYGFDTGLGGTVRGNYCTLNPLTTTAGTYTQGNLRYVGTATGDRRSNGTISVATGKWYYEVTLGNAPFGSRSGSSQYNSFGWGLATLFNSTASANAQTDALVLQDSGYYKNFSGAQTDSGTAFSSGDVLSVAVDLDANTFTFRRNNTSLVTGTIGGTVGRELVPIIISYDGSYGVMDFNFGQRPFAYTAPLGYQALCTQNLPTPAIGGSSETLANEFFNAVIYTGDATNPRTITGVGFQPDWVWVKRRDSGSNNFLQDSVRGVTSTDSRSLSSNSIDAETNYYTLNGGVTAFASDGFTISGGSTNLNINGSGQTYVAWNWRAGNDSVSAGVDNRNGSIASQVSVNPRSGFSIVTYTGNGGSGATVGHGLDATPSMILLKARSAGTYNWRVYHSGLTAGYNLFLNTTDAQTQMSGDAVGYINSGVTQSTFTLSQGTSNIDAVNGHGITYVAYCFAEVPGYSKFGTYTGNGAVDGPFVFTGFRPRFILYKRFDGGVGNWVILDTSRNTYNLASSRLFPSVSNAETSATDQMDILSNGFKIRVAGATDAATNLNGDRYIYAAFAESPFKYSLAR